MSNKTYRTKIMGDNRQRVDNPLIVLFPEESWSKLNMVSNHNTRGFKADGVNIWKWMFLFVIVYRYFEITGDTIKRVGNLCLCMCIVNYFHFMRGSWSTAKLPMEFSSKYNVSFYNEVRSPQYCCVVLLDPRLGLYLSCNNNGWWANKIKALTFLVSFKNLARCKMANWPTCRGYTTHSVL